MTARAEIVAAELDNVLSVPVSAVVRYDEKDRVAVKTATGRIDWREVTLGRSNGTVVAVKQGLKAGEDVIVDPRPFLSDEQKAKVTPTPPAVPRAPASPGTAKPRIQRGKSARTPAP